MAGFLPLLFVVVAAAAAYVNALWNGFALDDVYIIANNARAHDPSNLHAIWLTPYWPSYGDQLGLYRPLAVFAYALQWAAAGGAPWLFHLVNLLLHAGVSALVYLFVLRLLPTVGGTSNGERRADDRVTAAAALLAGLVFALHPVHSEAVANVVGQAELIAAGTTLAACHLHATRPAGAALGPRRLAAIALLYALGMLAKESAIVLPALLVAVDAAQRRWRYSAIALGSYLRRLALPLVVLTCVAVGYLALRIAVLGSIGGVAAAPNLPFLREEHRVLVAFRAWPEYVRLLVFPADLSSDYSPAVILPVESLTPMAALGAVLLGATVVLALLTPAFPAAGFPAAWFLITILPVSNLLLPIGVVVAERLLYTPSVALSFIAAVGWRALALRSRVRTRRLVAAGAALVLIVAGAKVISRNPDWKDTAAVGDAIVRDHPESYRAQLVNAARATERGRPSLAREYLELAYRIWPNDGPMLNQLADLAIREGDYERAIALYERAHAVAPFVTAYDIGLAIAQLGALRPAAALPPLDRAGAGGANMKTVHALRAQAHDRLGQLDRAAAEWSAALRQPGANLWSFWAMYARSLARTGARADALAAADSALVGVPPGSARDQAEQLRAAIGAGCYDVGASVPPSSTTANASSCDPLAGWGIVVPVMRSENATELQNARRSPSSGADGGAASIGVNR